jgi:hypothetical protein
MRRELCLRLSSYFVFWQSNIEPPPILVPTLFRPDDDDVVKKSLALHYGIFLVDRVLNNGKFVAPKGPASGSGPCEQLNSAGGIFYSYTYNRLRRSADIYSDTVQPK